MFTTQPTNGAVNTALAPSVTVTLTDGQGATVPASMPVTLTTAASSAKARLNGNTIVTAVNGVATFDNVAVDRAANGLTLFATADTFAPATSAAFNVAGAAWQPVVFDPTTPTTLYALGMGTNSISVYKTTNAFTSVTSMSTGLSGTTASLLAIDPLAHNTLYLAGNHLYKTTDGATTWAPAEAGLPPILAINALSIDPATQGVVYAATNCGLHKTTSGGK